MWFVGDRFKNAPNIIWVLGGDRHPDERDIGVDLWRAMAEGLADGMNAENKSDGRADYTTTLMTHHGYNSSSNWFHPDFFVYIPTGISITIKLGTISGKQVKAWLYDPRTGESRVIGEFENTGERSFDLPGMSDELDWLRTGRGCDWVLVIDDSSKNFPAPGKGD